MACLKCIGKSNAVRMTPIYIVVLLGASGEAENASDLHVKEKPRLRTHSISRHQSGKVPFLIIAVGPCTVMV